MKVYCSVKNLSYYALLTLIKPNDTFFYQSLLYFLLITPPKPEDSNTKSSDKPANLSIFAIKATEDLSSDFFQSMNLPQGN